MQPSQEPTDLSKNLATQNGPVTAPEGNSGNASTVPTPTPTTTPVPPPYTTSPELTALSIALSPKIPTTTTPKRTIKEPSTPTMPTYEDAYKAESRNAQKEINLLNQYAAEQLASLQPRQEERLRETSSVNTLTGLAGSTEANRTTEKTTAVNQKENDLVRAEAAMKAQQILGNVSTKAIARAKEAREGFTAQYEMDQATKLAKQTEDFNEAITLAQSGVDLNAYKTQDPEAYSYLAESLGGEEMLKATFTLNRPKETILDKKIEGGKYIISYQNPIDGKVRIETVDLGLPVGYSKTIDAGNRILAIPDDWDGDPAKLVTINKGLTPGQATTAAGGSAGSGGGTYANDLDALIGATESIISSKFGQETFKKNIARARTEADKISLVASLVLSKADAATKTDFANQTVGIKQIDKAIKMLDEGTQSGVLQSGAQYAFNLVGKDFDPKLAELNQLLISAIQPYRNSVTGAAWGQQEDNEYQQLFGSTKYSPAELRQRLVNVKDVLASKSSSALSAYVNPLGTYGDPFNTGNIASGNSDIATRVDQAGFNYEAMKADGLSDSEILSAIGQ